MKNAKKYNKQQIIYLILVIIWMAVVFMFSNQQGEESAGTSNRVTQKILAVASSVTNVTQDTEQRVDKIVRKLAHFTIYLVGGILIMNYINTYKLKEEQKITYSILIGMIYAGTDELHQYFIEGRSCMLTDVIIDTLGVATGVIILCLVIKCIRECREKCPKSTIEY